MSDCMTFPKTAEEFIEQYKFTDTKQEYTNGAELIPVFRVKQMLEHYVAEGNHVPGKWIPVTERLPEKSGEYLIARSRHQLCVHYSAEHQMFNCHDTFSPGDAVKVHLDCTHWMPLPEPPKGE